MANGVLGWTHRWCRPETSDITAEEIGNTYAELMLAGLEHPYAGVAAASAA